MISITLPYPPSVNDTHDTYNGSRLSKKYRAWRDEAGWALKAQKPGKLLGEVSVTMFITPPDRRRRDADNLWKAGLDLLVKHKVIEDDNMSVIVENHQYVVREGAPGIVLEVRSVE